MTVSPIYDHGGHLDHATDINVYADDYRRQLKAEARAEELAIYGGETVTVTAPDTIRVTGRVKNRTQRGAA